MHGIGHGDPEPSGVRALEFLDQLFGLVQLPSDGATELVELLAYLGEVNLLAQALKQRQAYGVLELSDLHRNGGLRQVQLFRRACETEPSRDTLEDLELFEGYVHGSGRRLIIRITYSIGKNKLLFLMLADR